MSAGGRPVWRRQARHDGRGGAVRREGRRGVTNKARRSSATSTRRPAWPRPRSRTPTRRAKRASTAQNAEGGVNGRKIDVEVIDDQSSAANLTAAKDLVAEPRRVHGVINNSSFASCLPLPEGERRPDGRRRLRRHLLRRAGQREHHLGVGNWRRHRPHLHDQYQGDEALGAEQGRRGRLRRLGVVVGRRRRTVQDSRLPRWASTPCTRTPRSSSARTDVGPHRARDQELGRRRRLPAAGRRSPTSPSCRASRRTA